MHEESRIRWAVFVSIVATLIVCAYAAFQLRPWMKPGDAIAIGKWQFGDFEFSAWQRKNSTLTEPFATGLFVRKKGENWSAFLIDFEDAYKPKILLRQEAEVIKVSVNGKAVAVFDPLTHNLRRSSSEEIIYGAPLSGDPPGLWWTNAR